MKSQNKYSNNHFIEKLNENPKYFFNIILLFLFIIEKEKKLIIQI